MKIKIVLLIVIILLCKIENSVEIYEFRNIIQQVFSRILPFGIQGALDELEQTSRNLPILPKYDFIIVGGGPAGCVLANRLSENSNLKILLLEAGGKEGILHQLPLVVSYLQSTSSNWGYKSVPQKRACLGMKNRQCSMPRGKVLGGSSSINYMIYNRGNHHDFDNWKNAGNPGWSYAEVLPYFKKSEKCNLEGLENSNYHGYEGPLNVEYVPYRTNLVHSFVKACEESGLNQIDYNGESQIGVSYVQANTLRGQRQSAYRTYIYPLKNNRTNLHIMLFSKVTKILINPNTKTAYGVEFVNNGTNYSVKARKEVILSSGTFNSPQLLMLSGIGPAKHLKALKIPVIKDLPVGKIMYDHISHIGVTFVTNTTNQTPYLSNLGVNDIYDLLNGQGRLTLIGGVEALAFLKLPNSIGPQDLPNIELIFLAGGFASDEGSGLKHGTNIRDDIYEKVYKPFERSRQDHFTVVMMLFHPKSYGNIRLANKDPFSWPILNPNFYENPEDVEVMLQATKKVIKMMKAPAMQKIGARIHDIPMPGCEHIHFGSDNYWRCSIHTMGDTLHHQVGTCRMGAETDPTTVVNHELKVHGIKKLRVVDTSIIPFPTTSHTNAASFMIGEKASDMIKAYWGI